MNLHIYETGKGRASYNMALDEALLEMQVAEKIPPVLRLYGWEPAAVTIGYTQDVEKDIDPAVCRRYGVQVVRRTTGGGAVFHDREVTYSLVAPVAALGESVPESFREVSKALISGLEALGLKAVFAPLNDITVNDRKISGNAQVRRRGVLLQHGTILIGLDREKMFSLLRVPEEKTRKRNLARPEDRVTSLEEELGREVSFGEAAAAVRAGFAKWSGAELPALEPPGELLELAGRIEGGRFAAASWNMERIAVDV